MGQGKLEMNKSSLKWSLTIQKTVTPISTSWIAINRAYQYIQYMFVQRWYSYHEGCCTHMYCAPVESKYVNGPLLVD